MDARELVVDYFDGNTFGRGHFSIVLRHFADIMLDIGRLL